MDSSWVPRPASASLRLKVPAMRSPPSSRVAEASPCSAGVTLLRGVLSPLGHGTWTAILAGVLFRETRGRRFRLDGAVIGAYLTVSLLHGLWDGLPGLLDSFLVPGADVLAALAVVSATGLVLLWWRWREAVRLQMASVGQDR